MAIEEFGPTVLGNPIELISADHQMKVDVGAQLARGWFDNGKIDAIVDEAAKVMPKMRELSIDDAFVHQGKLREDGRDMYLARVKKPEQSKEPWDYFEIVRTVKGDDAFRPVSESKCPLLKR
jgi:hypothetical protein